MSDNRGVACSSHVLRDLYKLRSANRHTCAISPGFPPHLENLEKQSPTWKNRGFSGKNLEKYCKTWKKILTLP